MKLPLAPSRELSDEQAESRDGEPVLVHRSTGDAHGPGDILQASPSVGLLPAARVVARLAKTKTLDADGRGWVERCARGLPPREQ